LYSGVFKIVSVAYIFGVAISNSVVPRLFREYEHDRGAYVEITARLMQVLLVIAIVLAGSMYFLARPAVTLIIGPEYEEAIVVMRIMGIAILFRTMNFGLGDVLMTG